MKLLLSVLKDLPYWIDNPILYDNLKDTGLALVGFSTSIAGTLKGSGDE
jgi:hypothetical protein